MNLNRLSRRSLATVSSLSYSRTANQVPVAPPVISSLSKVSNVQVATLEDAGPVSSLAIVVQAGARAELVPGAAHFLQSTLIRNLPGDSVVRTIRETELRGNTLYSGHSRETLVLGSDFLRDDLVDVVPMLLGQIFNASYQPFEFLQARDRIAHQSASALSDPRTAVLDALHQVAFRHGLGNSLYAKDADVHHLKRADLSEFAARNFAADRMVIVGTGVAHEELEALVASALKGVQINAKGVKIPRSVYYGGETRLDRGAGSEAHYVIAYPSVSSSSPDYPASLVLQSLLDGHRRLKYGSLSGVSCLLAPASTGSTSVSAFGVHHSDAGLLGFYIQGVDSEVGSVASKSIAALKSIAGNGVEQDALARARKAAIVELEDSMTRDNKIEFVAQQVLNSGKIKSVREIAQSLETVTLNDVQKLASDMLKARPSVVASGNVRVLPFADQL